MNTIRKISYSKLSAHSGFTLVEVMVTVVILGVIATIATPSISNQLANQRVKSTTTTLMNVLREARSESNINRMPVTVSYINNSQSYNVINVEVPYSGPLLSFSLMRTIDWMGFFMNSALALDTPPKNPDNNGGGTTGGGTTGGGTTGGGTTDGGTTDGGTTGGGTNSNLVIIATYKYDLRTTINSSANRITFKPNKNVDAAVTYTICDTNKSVSPRQVSVSINGLISSKLGGSCS